MAEVNLLVVHQNRRDYGVGTVTAIVAGKPPVYRVVWPIKAPNGEPLWGYYRMTDLAEFI